MSTQVIESRKNGQIKLYRKSNDYFVDNDSYWMLTVHFEFNNKKYYIIIEPQVNNFKLSLGKQGKYTKWHISKGNREANPSTVFYYLPFDCNHPRKCSQGNSGIYSHNGPGKYSVDFSVPKGTPVLACRPGIVVDVKSDSDRGGPDKSFADDANHIFIQHEDDTIGQYLHLQKDGVLVKEGQYVNAGEKIGFSGNTGWATGPHLHFECCIFGNKIIQSVPIKFYDGSVDGYIPLSGLRYSIVGSCNPVIRSTNDQGLVFNIYEHSKDLIEIRIENKTPKNYEVVLKVSGENIRSARPSVHKSDIIFEDILPAETERTIVTFERDTRKKEWNWDYTCDWREIFKGKDLRHLYNLFKQIDKDSNGYIEYCEFWHWLTNNPNESFCTETDDDLKNWHKMDLNNDGIATFAEFVKYYNKK